MNKLGTIVTAALLLAALSHPAAAQLGGDQTQLLEPNVAADSQLTRIGLNERAINLLREARPILSVASFDSILGAAGLTKAQRVGLLSRVFVHVDLNRGSDLELMFVPGMNAARVAAIKAGRPFATFDAFRAAMVKTKTPQSDPATLERYLFIPINLNTFTEPLMDTFASIGVGTRRWKREFAEYRPWTSTEQFRREIGKYVRGNPKEVTRLERYVIIR